MIEIRNVTKRFGDFTAIDKLDLTVDKSSIYGLVGYNGAGKTTLLQVVGTLLTPDAGRVLYDATDVFTLSDKRLSAFRNKHIGFVFQFHQLLPEFTLLENVALPAIIAGDGRHQAEDRARSLIDRLGLASRASHRPAQLSGGECQRAAVARALVNSPSVVLADEPTGSLDSHNREQLHRLFFELRDELGATFVIVTHDERLAADSDRIVRMADGAIVDISSKQ